MSTLKKCLILSGMIILAGASGFFGGAGYYYLKAPLVYHVRMKQVPSKPVIPWATNHGRYLVQPVGAQKVVTYKFMNPDNYGLYHFAIDRYNKLGVVKLRYSKHATIHLYSNTTPKDGGDGLGDTDTQSIPVNSRYAIITHAQCYLLPAVFQTSLEEQIDVAEHELGHALGLAHDNSLTSHGQYRIMNSGKPGLPAILGIYEQHGLAQMYDQFEFWRGK